MVIQNHIKVDLLPFSEIEKEGFQELVGGLIGPLVLKSRRSIARLLSKIYDKNKQILIAELENIEHVSTTAD